MAEDANVGVAVTDAKNSKEREVYFRGGSVCDNRRCQTRTLTKFYSRM